ncbi:MAG: CPBP family intramembrane metalloprotease [Alphaproteobacteria bacterium]|mgnify:CR=1 FL=1|nr:CPBP family intramembrane metalloprotease [Alphaproteobacteria bacterium]MBT4083911.1 CPBP family intramembrane metalloprotease [Alphaproteobacteria bacterium]MBT4546213.1 CPBP family intramembrane metalloprotease [Alphaproteobacteria bacterium]MBT7746520.1 CPBP family intramembrane metalloprotease [Alphaproteobacteria bacterium]
MIADKIPLPQIDGRTVFHVLLTIAGLIGLVIIAGSIVYWQTSGRFLDLEETPWPLVVGSLVQTLIIVVSIEFGWRRRKELSFRDIGFQQTGIGLLVMVAIAGFVLAGTIEGIERQLGIKPGDLVPELIAPQGFVWPHFVAVLITVGVIAPIAEEMIFRGVLYSWFRSRFNIPLAIFLNAGLFGLIHFGYPLPLMALVALMGAVFAWSFERTGSLWVPIVLHIGQNSAVVIAVYATLYFQR